MAVKYYKKFYPNNPVVINEGKNAIHFDTFDNVLGYYATEDPGVQEQFLTFMKEQRYGISEIAAAEFDESFTQKKMSPEGAPPPPRWREEIGSQFRLTREHSAAELLGLEKARAALAVSGFDGRKDAPRTPAPVRMENPALANGVAVPAKEKQPFVPTLGKRKIKG